MALTNILITVKTYPSLSESYQELVCTAGFREDGSMIRIYPVPYRQLDDYKKYKKYQWITIDVKRRTKDFRPESFSPVDIDKDFVMGQVIDSKHWDERKKIVLKNVYYNMSTLISDARNPNKWTSLAVVKPQKVFDFYWEEEEREWNKTKLAKVKAGAAQKSLFETNADADFEVVRKLPYKFKYKFVTEDGIERNMMIEDWEIGALYLKYCDKSEELACLKVKEKFFNQFIKTDLHFYVGTTLSNHQSARNPFVIIGTFTPPKVLQQSLF
jgi:hypothetical protein